LKILKGKENESVKKLRKKKKGNRTG